jgi:hypothetical protein
LIKTALQAKKGNHLILAQRSQIQNLIKNEIPIDFHKEKDSLSHLALSTTTLFKDLPICDNDANLEFQMKIGIR